MTKVILFLLVFMAAGTGAISCSELHIFAGAGLRQPLDKIIGQFQNHTGRRVLTDYDGSGRLLAKIIASGQGDLFMPGSLFYIEKLKSKGIIHSFKPIVAHTPVIAVNKEKSPLLRSFTDLAKPGIRIALGDPKAMALGKTAMQILDRSGPLREKIIANVAVYGATVKQLAIYVARGDVDASIIARADAIQFKDKVEMIPIPEAYYDEETVAVSVLNSTKDLNASKDLQDYLSSPAAVEIFESFGFLPLKKIK